MAVRVKWSCEESESGSAHGVAVPHKSTMGCGGSKPAEAEPAKVVEVEPAPTRVAPAVEVDAVTLDETPPTEAAVVEEAPAPEVKPAAKRLERTSDMVEELRDGAAEDCGLGPDFACDAMRRSS